MNEIAFIQKVLAEVTPFVQEQYLVREQVSVTSKKNVNDLLTEVDVTVQRQIIRQIREDYPNDAIAAEEEGFSRFPSDPNARCWVIDPIDGTQNFVRGIFPCFGISVAFAVGDKPVAGGVMLPIGNDLFLAEQGSGATRNGKRISVSSIDKAGLARVEIDFSGPSEREETLRRASTIICQSGQIRCNCSSVVSLCSVACDEMDAFLHVSDNPWDYAAGQILVTEAGGQMTRLDGTDLFLFDHQRGMLASNGRIHDELLAMVDK